MLVLATGYIGCIISFTHMHVVDGIIVVHAHKSPQNETGQHQHTPNELTLFHAISHYHVPTPDVPQFKFKEWINYSFIWDTSVDLSFPIHYYHHCQFRAPPSILS